MGATHPDKQLVIAALDSAWPSQASGNSIPQRRLEALVLAVKGQVPIDTAQVNEFLRGHIAKSNISLAELHKLLDENWSPEDLAASIRKQVEFYLSDANLKTDKFFHDVISSSADGYVSMDVLLKCRKLKSLTSSPDVIAQALKSSTEVEVNSDGSGVRRTGNAAIPELSVKKKTSAEAKSEPPVLILKVSVPEETKATWKELRDSFKAAFIDTELTYTRFHGQEGHIGVRGGTSAATVQNIITTSFSLDGQKVIISRIEGEELLDFWKQHGTHFELCSNQGKRGRETRKSMTFGGKNFVSQSKVKTYIKSLLSTTREGELVDPQYFNFLMDLLKLHPQYEEKAQGIKQFGVNRHPEHSDQKCFFVVKEDGSWVDFSAAKCVSQI
mmetsp:Transcript_11164/g.21955  ORF Transcript_11164/g.21955 Transcript_11164/m.21955 type:complete len:385 (-) Transcript_11164:1265-2419(-)